LRGSGGGRRRRRGRQGDRGGGDRDRDRNGRLPPPSIVDPYHHLRAAQAAASSGGGGAAAPPALLPPPYVPGATPAAAAAASARAYAALALAHGGGGPGHHHHPGLPPEKAAAAAAAAQRAVAAATKPARELYFGNLFSAVGEAALRQVLEASLYAAFPDTRAAVDAGGPTASPVLKTIVHPNGKFGFAEFRAPEHATACLALDGQIAVGPGATLLVARPVTYTEPVRLAAEAACRRAPRGGALPYPSPAAEAAAAAARQRLAADAEAAAALLGEAVGGGGGGGGAGQQQQHQQQPQHSAGGAAAASEAAAAASAPGVSAAAGNGQGKGGGGGGGGSPPVEARTVVVITGMATAATLRDPQDHADVLEDLKGECERHGAVTGLVVPRPPRAQAGLAEQLLGAAGTPYGQALARFADPHSAERCRAAVHGRVFDGRALEARVEAEAEFLAAEAVDDLAK